VTGRAFRDESTVIVYNLGIRNATAVGNDEREQSTKAGGRTVRGRAVIDQEQEQIRQSNQRGEQTCKRISELVCKFSA
jgi:hypothetical protein